MQDGYRLYYDQASDSIKGIGAVGSVGNADSLGGVPAGSYVVWGDTTEAGGVGIATKHDLDLIPAITDGDKDDITVSGTGTLWNIRPDSVSFAKMQNIGTGTLLGRYTTGDGDIQQIKLKGGLEFNNDSLSVDVITALGYTPLDKSDSTDAISYVTRNQYTTGQATKVNYSDSLSVFTTPAQAKGLISDSLNTFETLVKSLIGDSLATIDLTPYALKDSTYTKHDSDSLYLPKSALNDSTKFLDSRNQFSKVHDADLAVTDITTNNVSTSAHGFVPKAPNDSTKVFRGNGTWGTSGGTTTNTPKYTLVTSAFSTTSQSYVNVTGMFFTVDSNKTYLLKISAYLTTENTRLTLTAPSGTLMSLSNKISLSSGGIEAQLGFHRASPPTDLYGIGGRAYVLFTWDMLVETSSTPGTIQMRALNTDGNAGIVESGTFMTLTEVTTQ